MFLQFFFAHCPFVFRRAQLHPGKQVAKVLISLARGNKKWEAKLTTETRSYGGIFSF